MSLAATAKARSFPPAAFSPVPMLPPTPPGPAPTPLGFVETRPPKTAKLRNGFIRRPAAAALLRIARIVVVPRSLR